MQSYNTRLLLLISSLALLVWSGLAPGVPPAAATAITETGTAPLRIDLALVGGTLIDGRGGPPLRDAGKRE